MCGRPVCWREEVGVDVEEDDEDRMAKEQKEYRDEEDDRRGFSAARQ